MATQEQAAALADYVGSTATDYIASCVDVAIALVDAEAAACTDLPTQVRDRAVLEVGAELWHRRNAPNGVKTFGDIDSAAAIRVARDALVAARPLLDPYRNPLVFS